MWPGFCIRIARVNDYGFEVSLKTENIRILVIHILDHLCGNVLLKNNLTQQ